MSNLDRSTDNKALVFIVAIPQLDKAVSHYNNKKELLQENQQVVAELKHSLEVKESEVKAITMENKLLQLDLEKAQTNEKKLSDTVASLKAQVMYEVQGNVNVWYEQRFKFSFRVFVLTYSVFINLNFSQYICPLSAGDH